MPRYHFHIDDGSPTPDRHGIELPGVAEARAEAVSAAGSMLNELDGELWNRGGHWTMHVTDGEGRLLFSLHLAAEVPSGRIIYRPD